MNSEYWQALVRHALTAVGGFSIARGWVDAATVETIIGGAAALSGLVWSLLHKRTVVALKAQAGAVDAAAKDPQA